jgi:hypothetical protein
MSRHQSIIIPEVLKKLMWVMKCVVKLTIWEENEELDRHYLSSVSSKAVGI